MKKLTISSKMGIFIFYMFSIIWYIPLLLSFVSLAIHLPIYYDRLINRSDEMYYLQNSGSLAYYSVDGGGFIDIPNVFVFITSIIILLLFLFVNLAMTYKRTHAKWFLLSILFIYLAITIGLYSFQLIGF